jgi:methionine-rich copper-binding protein CopC
MVSEIGAVTLVVMLSGLFPGAAQAHAHLKKSVSKNWQAVSADTHKVKGSFTFQVRP